MLISFSVYLMQILNNGSDEDLLGLRLLHIFFGSKSSPVSASNLGIPVFFPLSDLG